MKNLIKGFALATATLFLFPNTSAQQEGSRVGPAPKQHSGVKLDDAYVGQYLLPAQGPSNNRIIRDRIITITKKDDKLFAERYAYGRPHWNKFELFPQSGEKFIHKFDSDPDNEPWTVSITFVRDPSGRVPQLIYTHENDPQAKKVIANRVSSLVPYSPYRQKLLEYVGRYQPEGKSSTIDINIEGNQLFIDDGKGKAGLFPDSEDRFLLTKAPTSIKFVRDNRGIITHLVVERENKRKTVASKL